ncbi:MAG: NUDIX domain-containing protein [Bacteroidota bacterium]
MQSPFQFEVAACLLFDKNGKLLIYLRDDKPGISFPNHWDLFGGIIEEGETPEQALVREVKEEIGIDLKEFKFFKTFDCVEGDIQPNRKYIYYVQINHLPEDLKLLDVGQRIVSIDLNEIGNYPFANILFDIVEDFANSGIDVPKSAEGDVPVT